MINYTIRRLLSAIPTLIIVAVMVFFLIRCVPGNPALTMLSDDATVEEIAAMEAKMGLDQPVPVQFAKWVGNAVRGDFGSSIYYDEPAMSVVMSRLESTWMLVIMAMFFSILIGVPLGMILIFRDFIVFAGNLFTEMGDLLHIFFGFRRKSEHEIQFYFCPSLSLIHI